MKLLPAVLLLFPLAALAANTATLSWQAPTTFSDGSPVGSTPITYNVYQGLQGQAKTKTQSAVTQTSATVSSGLAAGNTYCFTVTAVANSLESAPSNEACKTFPQVAPAAPTALTAQ